jgi:T5SS/PEP-CTERM-associated repeat protein
MATYTWTTDTSGLWGSSSNWSPAGPPGSTSTALITATGTNYTVSINNGISFAVASVTVNSANATVAVNGTLTASGTVSATNGLLEALNAGTVQATTSLAIAGLAGSSGTLESDGNDSLLTTAGGIADGSVGAGLLEALNGGSITLTGSSGITLGTSASGNGTILISGTDPGTGASALLKFGTTAKGITVGDAGQGTINVDSGGTIQMFGTGGLLVGSLAASAGFVNVVGPDALLNMGSTAGTMIIGQGSTQTSTLEVSGGGTLEQNSSSGGIIVAQLANSNGLITVTGTSSLLTSTAAVTVGSAGNGQLQVLNGGSVSAAGGLSITNSSSGSGTVTVNGGTLTGVGNFAVGNNGAGTLFVQGGGLVDDTGTSSFTVGFNPSSSGSVTVNGGTLESSGVLSIAASGANGSVLVENSATLTDSDGISVGNGGTATLTVQSSGQVSNTGSTNVDTGSSIGGSGTIVINGGTLSDTTAGFFVGGSNAVGSVLLESGSLVTGSASQFADISATGSGSAAATVTGGTWTSDGEIIVGDTGSGLLTINGGVVNAGTNSINVGNQATSTSAGTVSVSDGTLTAGLLTISNSAPATGTLIVNGLGSVALANLNVGAGGVVTMAGGNLSASGSVQSSGAIGGYGTLATALNNTATATATTSGSILDITGGVSGAGALDIDGGATLGVGGLILNSQSVAFNTGTAETLILGTPGTGFANAITGIAGSDRIEFNFGAGVTITGASTSGSIITVDTNSTTYQLTNVTFAAGSPTGLTFGTDGSNQYIQVLCFARNTRIATPSGEVPVEQLAVGDTVLTLDGKAEPIVWLGVGRVMVTPGHRSAATPVIVRKGALADNVPHRDLRVTKGHALFIDDALIPVEFLVNHRSIIWDDRAREIEVYHIELARHGVLLADGAPAESYRDDGNRWLFHNVNAAWHLPPQPPCAPVLTGGPTVDAAWRRLLDRTGPRKGVPLTDDADLHLLIDGVRIDSNWRDAKVQIFELSAPRAAVHIVSRAAVPQELGLARDARSLGVALRRVVLRQGTRFRKIEMTDAALIEGFHRFEPDDRMRWTDGDAVLPADLFAGFKGSIEVVLHLGSTTQYVAEGIVSRAA